jgi:hypothetical protein
MVAGMPGPKFISGGGPGGGAKRMGLLVPAIKVDVESKAGGGPGGGANLGGETLNGIDVAIPEPVDASIS